MPEILTGAPLPILDRWVTEADAAGVPLPSTMTLATADAEGFPHARTVVVTQIDRDGLRFHSSTPTTKTEDIAANPCVSAVFHWPALGRQVVLNGTARELPAEVSDAAYPTRPRQLQLVAWAYDDLATQTSAPDGAVERVQIRERFDAAATRDPLPRPASWITLELTPWRVDFWQAGTETTPPVKTRFTRGRTEPTRTSGSSDPSGQSSQCGPSDHWRIVETLP